MGLLFSSCRGTNLTKVYMSTSLASAYGSNASKTSSQRKVSFADDDALTRPLFVTHRDLVREWNLSGKHSSARRVDVVSDPTCRRTRTSAALMVDKCVSLYADQGVILLARNELEVACYLDEYARLSQQRLHPNLLHLRGYYQERKRVHVVFEYCDNGTMFSAVITRNDWQDCVLSSPAAATAHTHALPRLDAVATVMRQVCGAVAYLHAQGIVHGDVALENIYITEDCMLKLGDYDQARFFDPLAHAAALAAITSRRMSATETLRRLSQSMMPRRASGTAGESGENPIRTTALPAARPMYAAPELYTARRRTSTAARCDLRKADSWSLGVILTILLTRRTLVDEAKEDDEGFQLLRRMGALDYLRAINPALGQLLDQQPGLSMLLSGLLDVNPETRWSPAQALEGDWLRDGDDAGDDAGNTDGHEPKPGQVQGDG